MPVTEPKPTKTPHPPHEPSYEEDFEMPTPIPTPPIKEPPFNLLTFIKLIIGG